MTNTNPKDPPIREIIIATLLDKMKGASIDIFGIIKSICGAQLSEGSDGPLPAGYDLIFFTIEDFKRAGLLVEGPKNKYICGKNYRKVELFVTPLGKLVAEHKQIYLNPEIVSNLNSKSKWFKSGIAEIISEAYECWCSGKYRAAQTLVGLSAEFVISDFFDNFIKQDIVKKYFEEENDSKFDNWKTAKKIDKIRRFLNSKNKSKRHKFSLNNNGLFLEVGTMLTFFADSVRQIRNSFVHKNDLLTNPAAIYMQFSALIKYIDDLNDLAELLSKVSE